jgi:hypothetical protein
MSFVVRNNAKTAQVVPDLGDLTLEAGEERDLLADGDYLTEQLSGSTDLVNFLTATTFDRLTDFGGSVIPAGQAFDDQNTDAHIGDTSAHGLQIAVLANITDAGSGQVIGSTERRKLAGIESGAEVNDDANEILEKLQSLSAPIKLDVGTLQGQSAAALRDRATHTGTQPASTISDFDTAADARITAQKGAVNGIAELDANGRVPSSQLTVSAFEFKGNWDANANSLAPASGVGTQGDLYRVSVAGTTNLDGETDWQVGDQAVFDGTVWSKIDNTESVASVNGQQGSVVLDTDDVAEGVGNLYFTDARVASSPSVVANAAKVSADGSIDTHSDVDTTGAASGQLLGYNGSTWVPQNPQGETPLPAVQTRLGSDFLLTPGSWVDIPFDIRDEETDAASLQNPAASPESFVVQDASAPLQLMTWLPFEGAGFIESVGVRIVKNGSVVVPGTQVTTLATYENQRPLVVTVIVPASDLTVGDTFVVQMLENNGAVCVLSGATFAGVQLKGPRGEKGDPGSGVSIDVEDDGTAKGSFSTLNFGERLAVTDEGGGKALVDVGPRRQLCLGKASSQTFSGSAVCLFDAVLQNTSPGDFSVVVVGGGTEVVCNFDGLVEVTYDISLTRATGSRSNSESLLQRNGADVPFSRRYGYHRQTTNGDDSMTCSALPLAVVNGDVLRVESTVLTGGGSLRFMDNGCTFKLERIE